MNSNAKDSNNTRKKVIRQNIIRQNTRSLLMLTIGAIIAAFALGEFLIPNHIFEGER